MVFSLLNYKDDARSHKHKIRHECYAAETYPKVMSEPLQLLTIAEQ